MRKGKALGLFLWMAAVGWAGDPVAFPGAEGFGAAASGGRGGAVHHVTTLAASGPGSFQAALDASGPRTIIFDVSGIIDAVVILSRGDVTIAGETSPGGITVRGLLIQGDVVCEEPGGEACPVPKVAPVNFIVRHLRVRPAGFDDANGAGDGVRLHHAARGVLDHISVGNAADEACQVSFTRDVTIQWCHFAETVGEHSEFGGMLLNYSDPARGWPLTRLSIHHCLWNRIRGRLPEISRENVPDSEPSEIELANNVLWAAERPIYVYAANPQDHAARHYRLNVVNNYTAPDPSARTCYGLLAVEEGPDPERPSFTAQSSVYLAGNAHARLPALSDWQLVYNANDLDVAARDGALPYPPGRAPACARRERHAFPPITYTPGREPLVDALARGAGAFPRDAMDARLVAGPARRAWDPHPPDVNPAGDALAARDPFPPPPADTDRDGMPDAWERAHGLDPARAADGPALTADGYTNLEAYLHERHRLLVK